MKQTRKTTALGNAHIGPWFAHAEDTQKEIDNIRDSLVTNSAIIKDCVRMEKQTKLGEFNDKVAHFSESLSHTKYWNNLKKSTHDTSCGIYDVSRKLLDAKQIKAFRKKFGKLFSRHSRIEHNDLILLVKLAELKQKGIITTKEYDSKKKKILKKI